MTIGEALKDEQIKLGITSTEMAAGVVTKGTYSKVVNNKMSLSSDLLVQILFAHDINIENFFQKIKSTYTPKHRLIEEKLSFEMGIAFNNHKVEDAKKILDQIKNLGTNKLLEQRAEIAVAYLLGKVDSISPKLKNDVKLEVTQNSNWIFNNEGLKLLSTAMTFLSSENIESEMTLFFKKIYRQNFISEVLQEKYAMICNNYLHWYYDHCRFIKPQSTNVKKAVSFLKKLNSTPHLLIYIISGRYYEYLFKENIEYAKKIKMNLVNLGCTLVVNNWPE